MSRAWAFCCVGHACGPPAGESGEQGPCGQLTGCAREERMTRRDGSLVQRPPVVARYHWRLAHLDRSAMLRTKGTHCAAPARRSGAAPPAPAPSAQTPRSQRSARAAPVHVARSSSPSRGDSVRTPSPISARGPVCRRLRRLVSVSGAVTTVSFSLAGGGSVAGSVWGVVEARGTAGVRTRARLRGW